MTGRFAAFVLMMLVCLSATAARANFSFYDFAGADSDLQRQGDAAYVFDGLDTDLRIAPTNATLPGAVWHKTVQDILSGFETVFEFQLSDRTQGGSDGLAFVIQSDGTGVIGDSGEYMGYANGTISNFVAVEFDTHKNTTQNDPRVDHIAIMTGSDHNTDEIAAVDGFDFGTAPHKVRIQYFNQTMKVFLDGSSEPVLTAPIDLETVNGGGTLDLSGQGTVGLTAATGGGTQNHDILQWHFRSYAVTTVVTHGFQFLTSSPPGWAYSTGEEILAEFTGDHSHACGPSEVGSVFEWIPQTSGSDFSGTWKHFCGSTMPNGPIVLVSNWADESDFNTGGQDGFAEAAGDALYAGLRSARMTDDFDWVDPLAFDVHYIAHSRGTVVQNELLERMAMAGIAVDHMTTLDPHPNNGTLEEPVGTSVIFDWGDSEPEVWDNVAFSDNYFREDGGNLHSTDFDGKTLTNHDVEIQVHCNNFDLGEHVDTILSPDLDINPLDQEHIKIHAWYFGTIQPTPPLETTDRNSITLNPTPGDPDRKWWQRTCTDGTPTDVPTRAGGGYAYSLIRGATARTFNNSPPDRATPSVSPLSIFNGNFERVDADHLGLSGWAYQGGDAAGAWVVDSGNHFGRLPQPSSSFSTLIHNWFFVDDQVRSLHLQLKRVGGGTGAVAVELVDEADGIDDVVILLGTAQVEELTSDWQDFVYNLPAAARGRGWRLQFRLIGTGIIDIDDLTFADTFAPFSVKVPALGVVGLGSLTTILLGIGVRCLQRGRRSP